jgi:hypothetical protein
VTWVFPPEIGLGHRVTAAPLKHLTLTSSFREALIAFLSIPVKWGVRHQLHRIANRLDRRFPPDLEQAADREIRPHLWIARASVLRDRPDAHDFVGG